MPTIDVKINQPVTFELRACNDGTTGTERINVVDTLPQSFMFTSVDRWNGSYAPVLIDGRVSRIEWTTDVPQGECHELCITGYFTAEGTFRNSATLTIDGKTNDPAATSVATHDAVVTAQSMQVDISVVDSPDPVQVGANIIYTVTLTNRLSSTVPAFDVTVTFDPAITIDDQSYTLLPTQDPVSSGNVGKWNVSLPGSGSESFSVTGTYSNAGTRQTSAQITDPTGYDNDGIGSTAVSTLVFSPSAATVSIQQSYDSRYVNQDVTYTITAFNPTANDITGASISVAFDPAFNPAGDTTFAGITIPANNGQYAVTVRGYYDAVGSYQAVATLSIVGVPDDDDTSAALDVTAEPSFSLALSSDTPNPINVGTNLIHSVQVTNSGAGSASGYSITYDIPDNTEYVSHTGVASLQNNNTRLVWTVPTLLSGQSDTPTVTLDAATVGSGRLSKAYLSGPGVAYGSLMSNSLSTTTQLAGVTADISFSDDTPQTDENITITVTLTNSTGQTASNVDVDMGQSGGGWVYVGPTSDGGLPSGDAVQWSSLSVPAGTKQITTVGKYTSEGNKTSTAYVTVNGTETDTAVKSLLVNDVGTAVNLQPIFTGTPISIGAGVSTNIVFGIKNDNTGSPCDTNATGVQMVLSFDIADGWIDVLSSGAGLPDPVFDPDYVGAGGVKGQWTITKDFGTINCGVTDMTAGFAVLAGAVTDPSTAPIGYVITHTTGIADNGPGTGDLDVTVTDTSNVTQNQITWDGVSTAWFFTPAGAGVGAPIQYFGVADWVGDPGNNGSVYYNVKADTDNCAADTYQLNISSVTVDGQDTYMHEPGSDQIKHQILFANGVGGSLYGLTVQDVDGNAFHTSSRGIFGGSDKRVTASDEKIRFVNITSNSVGQLFMAKEGARQNVFICNLTEDDGRTVFKFDGEHSYFESGGQNYAWPDLVTDIQLYNVTCQGPDRTEAAAQKDPAKDFGGPYFVASFEDGVYGGGAAETTGVVTVRSKNVALQKAGVETEVVGRGLLSVYADHTQQEPSKPVINYIHANKTGPCGSVAPGLSSRVASYHHGVTGLRLEGWSSEDVEAYDASNSNRTIQLIVSSTIDDFELKDFVIENCANTPALVDPGTNTYDMAAVLIRTSLTGALNGGGGRLFNPAIYDSKIVGTDLATKTCRFVNSRLSIEFPTVGQHGSSSRDGLVFENVHFEFDSGTNPKSLNLQNADVVYGDHRDEHKLISITSGSGSLNYTKPILFKNCKIKGSAANDRMLSIRNVATDEAPFPSVRFENCTFDTGEFVLRAGSQMVDCVVNANTEVFLNGATHSGTTGAGTITSSGEFSV